MTVTAHAQLSTNKDKFLGNITTSYRVDYGEGYPDFHTLWNQITPENESKWDAIEPSRGNFNFSGADNSANYAKNHGFIFKYHTLIWGGQYPGWMNNLSTSDQYTAIVEYFDGVKRHFPNLEIIDVVNEAVSGHAPAPYKNALGGDGVTGYDWIIKAFEMAHERWPDAILVYNDYNTFRWQKSQFIDLVRTIRDAGAPVDAYGCQSHELTDCSFDEFKSAMDEIQNALKMPMYSTEYDIGTPDDNLQEQRYKEQIPYIWEKDYCAGVTLWGYIYGHTWTTDGNSGLIRNNQDRLAMTWLRQYMKSDAAKNAKSPFPGMKKDLSLYVKPASLSATVNEALPITVTAQPRTGSGKTVEKVELYVKDKLFTTLTEAPYTTNYTPTATGKHNLKAVVTTTDGKTYERLSSFTAYKAREPYNGVIADLPGTIQGENFDSGADGIAYHDNETDNRGGASYRNDGSGVDIESINGGYAVSYTQSGEWLEYTVDVKEAGLYEYDIYVSSQNGGGAFSFALSEVGGLTDLTGTVNVVKTGAWSTYQVQHGRFTKELAEGQQRLRFIVQEGDLLFNFDKIVLKRVDVDNSMSISMKANPAPATVDENTTLTVSASSSTSTIANVKIYTDQLLLKTLTTAPYEYTYKPTAKGTVNFTAIATDTEGRQSKIATYALKVNNKRAPYKSTNLPGTLQFENFDIGYEGLTFHDSDSENEGTTDYRTDGEGVDIVAGNGGYVIGYTATDEWLEYTVDVKEAGKYSFEAVVSSGISGASSFSLSLSDNGTLTALTDNIAVPSMGENDWDTYSTVSGDLLIPLEKGRQVIRATITGPYCNLDKITFSIQSLPGDINIDGSVDDQDVVTLTEIVMNGDNTAETVDLGHTPFRDMELPGTIEAEDFDCGGEGVAFHDDEEEDKGNVGYRTDNGGVDIVGGAPDGTCAIGYTPAGEWLEYTVDVKKEGIYSYEAIVSSGNTNSAISLSLNDGNTLTALTSDIAVPCPEENSWSHYESVEGRLLIPLQKGRQVIRMTITGGWCNIDKIKFTHVSGSGTLKGDLNADGKVDIVDITKLIDIILKQQ